MPICVYQANAITYRTSYVAQTAADGGCSSASELVLLTQSESRDYRTLTLGTPVDGITSTDAAIAFGWGFGVVALFWSMGWMAGVAKRAIARI